MKRLLGFIAALLVLGAVVPGCGGTHRYDSRLTAADSLIRNYPDSALALLEALPTDSLATEHDRAYRDLLLTQTRYKAYIPATSDSDINRALAYYKRHPKEQEKLTRAYLYKGAVMDELGYPDSAMFYYKHAEATVSPDDYFNLGYINMRIATLYLDQLSKDKAGTQCLKQAIYYFEIVRDTAYLISCYGNLGGMNDISYPDSIECYLNKAIELAQLYDPCLQYTYKSKLAGFYYYNNDYRRAKELAMDVLHNGKDFCEESQFYYYAAWSYLKLGLLDSAIMVFNVTPQPLDAVDSMNRLDVAAEIAKAKTHTDEYSNAMIQSRDYRIKIEAKRNDTILKRAETDYLITQAEKRENKMTIKYYISIIAIIVLLVLIVAFLVKMLYRKRLHKMLIEEKTAIEQELSRLKEWQGRLLTEKNDISTLVGYRIDALNELFYSIRFKVNKTDKDRSRSIIFLSSVVKGLSNDYKPMQVELSEEFWSKLKKSIDGEFRGIATFVEERFPDLSLKDLRLFYLLCAKISPQLIKICMNYTSWKSVTNNRSIIIKKKMGYDLSLDEFINKYMTGELK